MRQEAVLAALRLRGVEPADDTVRGVGDDAPLDLARGLLGADEDHAEASSAFGDIEHDLLDRTPALAGCVFVQLIEHDERERIAAAEFVLLGQELLEDDADDEALGGVVEAFDIYDVELALLPIEAVLLLLSRVEAADEMTGA